MNITRHGIDLLVIIFTILSMLGASIYVHLYDANEKTLEKKLVTKQNVEITNANNSD